MFSSASRENNAYYWHMKTSDLAGHRSAARSRQKSTSRTWGPVGGERLKRDLCFNVNFLTTKRWHVVQYGRWRAVQHSSFPPWTPFAQEETSTWPGQAEKPWPEWLISSSICRRGRPSPSWPPQERQSRSLPQVPRGAAGRVCREKCFCPFCHQLWSELGGCGVSPQHTPGNPGKSELRRAKVQRATLAQRVAQTPQPLGVLPNELLWQQGDDDLPAQKPPQGAGLRRIPTVRKSQCMDWDSFEGIDPPGTPQCCNTFNCF